MSGDRSVLAGRDMKGNAIAQGDYATATASYSATIPYDPSVDPRAELAALRQILASIAGVDKKALTRLEEAQDETDKPQPDRGEVGRLIEQATNYAQASSGLMEQTEKLAPHLVRLAGWLGRAWSDWGPALGL